MSLWWIANLITNKFPQYRISALIAFLFFPTVVFWSSGIIKESVSVACIMVISSLALSLIFRNRFPRSLFLLLFPTVIILWMLKYYYLIVLIPAWAVIIIYYQLKPMSFFKIFLLALIPFMIIWLGGLAHPNLKLERIPVVVYDNYLAYSAISKPDNLINFPTLKPEAESLIVNFPKAVIIGITSPLFSFSHNWLKAIISLENLYIVVLILTSLTNLQRLKSSPYSFLIIITILFIFIMAGFLSLSSPNLGSLSRYKVVFMPFLIFIVTIDNPLIKRIKFFNLYA